MIPGPRVLQDPQTYEHHQPWDLESASATPGDWLAESEETVILGQPGAARTYSESAREIACDVTTQWPSPRRSPPMWAIAAALLVGATLTFSANAMMHRPGRLMPAKKPVVTVSRPIVAPRLAPQRAPDTVRSPTPVAPAMVPAALASPPIVVPTLIPSLETDRALQPGTRRTSAARMRKHGHFNDPFDNKPVARAATLANPARKVRPASDTPGTTVSPAEIPAPAADAPDTTSEPALKAAAKPTAAKPTAKLTWIDPFAN